MAGDAGLRSCEDEVRAGEPGAASMRLWVADLDAHRWPGACVDRRTRPVS